MNLTPRSGSSWRSTITSSGLSLRSDWTWSSSSWAKRTGDSSARTTPRSARASAVLTWSENPGSVEISAARRLRSFIWFRSVGSFHEPEGLDQRAGVVVRARALGEIEEPRHHRLVAILLVLDEDHREVVELELRLAGAPLGRIEERHDGHPRARLPLGIVRIALAGGAQLLHGTAQIPVMVGIRRLRPAGIAILRDELLHALLGRPDHVAGLVVVRARVRRRVGGVFHVELHFDRAAGRDVLPVVLRARV